MQHEDLRKANHVLFFIFAVFALLYVGDSFLIPFTFGVFLASLMVPVANILERLKLNRILTSFICTSIIFITVGILFYLFLYHLSRFARDFPAIRMEFQSFVESLQFKISTKTGLSLEEQNEIFKNRSETLLRAIESTMTTFLRNILDTTIKFLLVLIYVFLFMMYRMKFSAFLLMYIKKEKEEKVKSVILKISKVVYQYLWGRLKVMAILALMYYVVFLIFDIPYAILLTIFGALVTIVPYIGPFISGLLPIIFALLFGKELYDLLIFSSTIVIIQLIESYLLEPIIIGKEVELNPLTVIIAVILGGMIWGVAGMVLFVPIFAILKIISNNTSSLKPVGYLLGASVGNQNKRT